MPKSKRVDGHWLRIEEKSCEKGFEKILCMGGDRTLAN